MCKGRRTNSGSWSDKKRQRPVIEGWTRHDNSDYRNKESRRITTTSQGTGGTPPKQGK